MSRSVVQDVLPPERRSIRVLSLETKREQREQKEREDSEPPRRVKKNPSRRPRRWFLPIALLAAIVVAVFTVASLFEAAIVNVKTRSIEQSLNGTIMSAKGVKTGSSLQHEVLTLTKEGKANVPAKGEERVERRAQGRIVVYNNFSATPQRLIKNTRFETPEGLIFRINDSVVIPGRSGAGSESIPGSVEVLVYADEPGPKYNITLKDFTIPGFRSEPLKFAAFYGRSKTPIAGGFIGVVPKASEADIAAGRETIRQELVSDMLKEAEVQIPAEFVLVVKPSFFTFESIESDEATGSKNEVIVRERGVLRGLIFKRQDLAEAIAKATIAKYDSLPIDIKDFSTVELDPILGEDEMPWDKNELTFTLKGTAFFIYRFDEEALRQALVGKHRSLVPSLLESFGAIEDASIVLRPFWKRSFPTDAADIRIVETY